MDCNKEEAVRAKGIAEKKLQNRDFQQARKMALRAQQLDPSVDNICQLVMVCDVHCSAEKKFGNEIDWYGILQVQQSADEATIKKQYRKFALLLHPDKNNLPGAEAAFKLIEEAQRILLDHTSRAVHDRKRNASSGIPGLQSMPFSGFPEPYQPPHGTNWKSNVGVQSHPQSNFSGFSAHSQPSAQPEVFNGHRTFWTSCPFCKMKYQYYRDIINKPLTCQTCKKIFVAYDINLSGASQAAFPQQGPFGNETKVDIGSKSSSSLGSKKGGSFSRTSNPTVKSRKINRRVRKRKENSGESHSLDTKSTSDSENESVMCDDNESKGNQVNNNKRSSELAVRRSTRQRQHISYKETGSDEDDITNASKRSRGGGESLREENGSQEEAKLKRDNSVGRDSGVLNRPDTELNSFDKDRGVECFADGQLWAVYDAHDNMPRSYALIRRVYGPGFEAKITWLEPDADGVHEINWIKAGLPVATGCFKLGKDDIIDNIRLFSHLVMWDEGFGKGTHKVLPMLGETWALFKNWDLKWSFDTNKKYEYDVVEVLSDYSQENGIKVCLLGRVEGFVSVFCRTVGEGCRFFRICRAELYRFSHRIPSFKLTGSEGRGIPVGSFELDPASVPSKLDETIRPEEIKPESGPDGFSDQCDSDSSEDSCVPLSNTSNGPQAPEPEFFNFDDAKSPSNFEVGQIWALYSDEDSLPKYYGLITEVTTQPKFQIQLSWLVSKSLPKGAVKWRDRKMLISCGRFKIDKSGPVCYSNSDPFSHCLNASTSWENDGTCDILPRKGEIWALYKSWNLGIRSSALVNCDYDLAEVIEADGSVITVTMLERLCGFSCVYRPRSQGFSKVTLQIPMVEILRFSHQLPAFRLTEEKQGSLRGFWEVDPLALPARYFAPN